MAQGALLVVDANGARQSLEESVLPSGSFAPNVVITDANGLRALIDATSNLSIQGGGRSSLLNLTAAGVVKAAPGRLRRIIIAPGSTSGAFTFNDCLTTGAAAPANEIFTLPYNAPANVIGYVINLDWPCATGIVLSAVPGAGSPICAVSFD